MYNWQETRKKLLEINSDFILPQEWEWRMNLRGADLRGANLENITVSWNDHYLLSEILGRKAGDDIEKLKIAGLIRFKVDWCWEQFMNIDDPLAEWALTELAKWHHNGDDIPEELQPYISE